jgi:hypothetical protein
MGQQTTGTSRGGRSVGAAALATCMVLLYGLAAPAAGAGSPPGMGLVARPAAATPTPPGGIWHAVHGPTRAALWATDPPRLAGVHVVDTPAGVFGYAVGTRGALVRLQDGVWTKVDDLDPKKTTPLTYDLNGVFVIAPDDVWVVSAVTGDRQCGTEACGALLHYDGRRWQAIDRTTYGISGRVPPMRAIDMIQGGSGAWFGWVVGNDLLTDTLKALILRFKDGKWRVWSGPNNFARHLRAVKNVAPGEAWLVGEAGVESWYTERDSGLGDWAALGKSGADDLYALDLADPLYGWDGGAGGRMNRYQGHCHDDDLGTQCWFDNQAHPIRDRRGLAVSQDVNAIDLLTRSDGWLVGAASARRSLVAWLDGAAQMWNAADVEGEQGTSLYGLHMLDTRRGFAVGDKGTILEYRDDSLPTPTASATVAAATATPTPTATSAPSSTPALPADTATPTVTETARPSRTPTGTPMPPTVTPTTTGTASPTRTASATANRPSRAHLYLPWAIKPRRR